MARRLSANMQRLRQWARTQTTAAILKGELVPSTLCERCRQPAIENDTLRRLTVHHRDYRFPLVVEWLCHWCHLDADSEKRALEQAFGCCLEEGGECIAPFSRSTFLRTPVLYGPREGLLLAERILQDQAGEPELGLIPLNVPHQGLDSFHLGLPLRKGW